MQNNNSKEDQTMKKTRVLYAVTILAVIALSGVASARGGNPGGGRGSCANCPNQTSTSSGPNSGAMVRQQTGTQLRPMDGTGHRYGQASRQGMPTAAPQAPVITPAPSTTAQ